MQLIDSIGLDLLLILPILVEVMVVDGKHFVQTTGSQIHRRKSEQMISISYVKVI